MRNKTLHDNAGGGRTHCRKVRVWACVIVLVALVIGAGLACYWFVAKATDRVVDEYAALQATDMLIAFMRTHQGEWPKRWEDLRDVYEVVAAQGESSCTFDKLNEIVWIDFEITPDELKEQARWRGGRHRTFLRLRSGRAPVWFGVDMNKKILEYLIATRKRVSFPEETPNPFPRP